MTAVTTATAPPHASAACSRLFTRETLARAAERPDQIPLAHLRAARDALLLRELVELLAVPVLERVARFAAAAAGLLRLLDEAAPRALRQVRDRPLLRRHLLRLLHVALRRLDLLPTCHAGITSL